MKWHRGDPIENSGAGVPTTNPLQIINWRGGRGGHLGFSPVLPAGGEHVLKQFHSTKKRYEEIGVDYYGSFTLFDRYAINVNMMVYDRDDKALTTKSAICSQFSSPTPPRKVIANIALTFLSWTMSRSASTTTITPSAASTKPSRTRSIPTASSPPANRASGPRCIAGAAHDPAISASRATRAVSQFRRADDARHLASASGILAPRNRNPPPIPRKITPKVKNSSTRAAAIAISPEAPARSCSAAVWAKTAPCSPSAPTSPPST